jgi:isopenicillin N synthase-like dioxygenase
VLEEVIRLILNTNPEYRNTIYRVRREPTLENVVRIAIKYIPEEDIYELIQP